MKRTKDPVNQSLIELEEKIGLSKFGLMNNAVWYEDPKRLLFTASRYKFVAKILSGYNNVAEIGCGDGFCSRIVKQEVQRLTITDFDPLFIERFADIQSNKWPITAKIHDILKDPIKENFDALYSLDVMEHIAPELEDVYLTNIKKSLTANGVAIIGMPSLESQQYASAGSKAGHINCKTGKNFKESLKKHFNHVFLFSMNDEVVHTGFYPMAHYLLGLCISPELD
ncbi:MULTISPECIES: class I SAM-dependent methyltransferase [Leptospira]|nr:MULTISPECIES: class I SAM-dependent methyltransferase [Leptospira]AXX16265.1 class I SAM-dependent methyltransferase [Leptospira borgpetersenii serovar Ceylonica]EKQ90051.1 methyltransferase domain protein [Leptospira borgpetersenii str. UI 09149]EMK08896.1 methyltransferase domain protein [Leptospira sp. serovar Kenya str. Sh9]QVK46554.1 class I SAM-dependent methyltransferase [Leptospira borgpetersenii]QVK52081.1 class I SAM-dependent methyltransferase [Leptospira borgpetersenii]